MSVSNAALAHGKELFERKVEEDLATKRKAEDIEIKEANEAADAARQAVLASQLKDEEITVDAPADGGTTRKKLPNALAHQVLTYSGREDKQNINPNVHRQRVRVRSLARTTRSRQNQNVGYAEGR
jgi:tryptophan synthase beta subunit